MFIKKKELEELLEKSVIDIEHFKQIEKWKEIYSGYFKEWHDVKYMTIEKGTKTRRLKTLNMAKVACEKLSKYIFTEKVEININKEEYSEIIHKVLEDNRFYKVFQGKLEKMFALGGLVLKANPVKSEDGNWRIEISYVTPDLFIPLTVENEVVTEAAFMNITRKKDKIYTLFEIHEWVWENSDDNENSEPIKVKKLRITNELYESPAENNAQGIMKKVPLNTLYPDLKDQAFIEGLSGPLFKYIKPNIENNIDINSPLGISIFANALDTLHALDIAFDSFFREFKLGRRRIIVPASAVRTVIDPTTGEMQRYFDANDEVYQAFNIDSAESQKIIDNTVSLRVEEHIRAINSLLNLYAIQIGFSPGSFTFDGLGVKTATEVVSENSETYQTITSNENLIEEGLKQFFHTIIEVGALYDLWKHPKENGEEIEIDFHWDDNVVKDKYMDADFYIKLKDAGLIPKYYTLMKILGMTEEEAKKLIEEVKEENASETPEIPDLLDDLNLFGEVENNNNPLPDEQNKPGVNEDNQNRVDE